MIGVDENLCVHSPAMPKRCGRASGFGDEYDGDCAHTSRIQCLCCYLQIQREFPKNVPDVSGGRAFVVSGRGENIKLRQHRTMLKNAIPGETHSCLAAMYR
jgi:hypothetical protein